MTTQKGVKNDDGYAQEEETREKEGRGVRRRGDERYFTRAFDCCVKTAWQERSAVYVCVCTDRCFYPQS